MNTFDFCMFTPCYHYSEQDIEHILHPIKFPVSLPVKTHPLPWVTTITTSVIAGD